jgi:hypothetical protein
MSQYFAQINDDNVVVDVHVVTQEFIDANPDRYPGTWVETFFDKAGKQYAGVGFTYDSTTNNFTPPPPPVIVNP